MSCCSRIIQVFFAIYSLALALRHVSHGSFFNSRSNSVTCSVAALAASSVALFSDALTWALIHFRWRSIFGLLICSWANCTTMELWYVLQIALITVWLSTQIVIPWYDSKFVTSHYSFAYCPCISSWKRESSYLLIFEFVHVFRHPPRTQRRPNHSYLDFRSVRVNI